MKSVFPLAFLVSWFVVLPILAQSRAIDASPTVISVRIDSIFRQWDNPNSPGCSLGIIRNGKFIYLHSYGMADLKNQIPITSTTVFNIASLSKQFTAASLVLLSERGKLDLDDNVRTYIPELPDNGTPITIRELLNHTSGIRDYIQMMFLAGSGYGSVVTTKDALTIIARQKALNFKPGDEWLYSNSGYALASLIVERVSGKPIKAFERENIFEPLGMKNTVVVDDHMTELPRRATGYTRKQSGGFQTLESNWEDTGDGGVHSTVEDLLLWDRNFDDPKVGGKEMIDQLLKPARLNDGTLLQYALGLGVWNYNGLKVVNHEGEWAGYRAEFMRFSEQHFSVIILCNLSTMVPLRLAEQVSEIYLLDEMKKAQPTKTDASPPSSIVVPSPEELDRYTGMYRSPTDELVRQLVVRNGKLFYVRGPNSVAELTPIGKNKFRMVYIPVETDVVFASSASGQISGMQVITEGTKPIAFKLFTPVVPTPEQLAQYCGTYHSDELDVDYRVLTRDSSLFLKTTDPNDDQLRPTVNDVFKLSDVGILRFTRDEKNAVNGFSFTFGKVRNVTFVRKQ